jgi:hypothetical protein
MCRARERVVLQSKYYIQYSGHVWKLCCVRHVTTQPVGSAVRKTQNSRYLPLRQSAGGPESNEGGYGPVRWRWVVHFEPARAPETFNRSFHGRRYGRTVPSAEMKEIDFSDLVTVDSEVEATTSQG